MGVELGGGEVLSMDQTFSVFQMKIVILWYAGWGDGGGVEEKKEQEKVTQSCPNLCDPMDYRVHGILQARILEWVAIPFSRGSSQPRDWTQVSHTAADPLPAEPPGKPKKEQGCF